MNKQFTTKKPPTKDDLFKAIQDRNSSSLDSVDVTLMFPTVRVDITLRLLNELVIDKKIIKEQRGIRNHYSIAPNE